MSGRGRFAPSPTGDLHLGSLTTALASCLHAAATGADWIVRLEDVDQARSIPGAAEHIFSALTSWGFHWPTPVVFQSNSSQHYEFALDTLQNKGLLYRCGCGRSDYQGPYPGTCRQRGRLAPGEPRGATGVALRLSTATADSVHWQDEWHGTASPSLTSVAGDFVVRRKDGFHAYQLAVVVDDARQGVTQVVRGRDLMEQTAQQRYLQDALGLPHVSYAHVPLVTASDGSKLSKSSSSEAIAHLPPAHALWLALQLLRQHPPQALSRWTTAQIWEWAYARWNPDPLRGVETLQAPAVYHPPQH